ncbi:hypothetical protein AUJ84_00285 [Candidatus Pacearchaeota archaeon CG1_02_32_132]|nr:MAG: hypothetical protein AUJ84_00285 [Candidatus Pacearchaeota archaeon CG1_02_32_132]
MKTNKFVLSFFALFAFAVLLTSSASAGTICGNGINLCITNVIVPQNISHGTDVPISFQVTYEGSLPTTILDFTGTKDNANIATITGFPTGDDLKIGNSQTKVFTTFTLVIPPQATGTIKPFIKVKETGANSDEEQVHDMIIIEDKRLLVNTFTAPTSTSQGTLVLKNPGNFDLTNIVFSTSGNIAVQFTPNTILSLLKGAVSQTIALTITNFESLRFGSNPTTITATADGGTAVSTSSFEVKKSFCSNGQIGEGNLTLRSVNIDNTGNGKNDKWQLLDNVDVEVDVKNIGSDTINDVFVEIALFDKNGIDSTGDLDFSNKDEEQFDIGKIKNGNTETAKFTFKVPADMIIDNGYMFAVKAYSDDVGESQLCVDTSSDLGSNFFESIDIDEDPDNNIIVDVDNIFISPSESICGEDVSLSIDAYNVGGNGEEDRTLVRLKNTELGLNKEYEIKKRLDDGDKGTADFSFTIPKGVAVKTYSLEFETDYDYRNGDYHDSSKDTWFVPLKVISCGSSSGGNTGSGKALISASLDSDAIAGQDMSVTATITNLGSETATFTLDVLGYESWATLDSVSPSGALTIEAGQSQKVILKFNVDKDASDTESFTIRTLSGGSLDEKQVQVNIDTSGSKGFTGFSISGLTGSGYTWLLVLVNVILIVLIVVVAIRLSRR